ncbi:DUF3137 domain-containing protein [Nostoc sp.]|uniref:DUF3137 domain-containing protein n=1 Tax=Nostoc sp. TaxID=1180 RepID=UPI002FFAC0CB
MPKYFSFFIFQLFIKNLRTVTIIQPKVINANIHALNHAKKHIIKLEDPEFAKFFTVYGDDQIEARYVLSTSLMDKIVNFRKKTNRNIYIYFVDDMIYIAIEEAVENNLFEPNLFKSVLGFAPLREYFETLRQELRKMSLKLLFLRVTPVATSRGTRRQSLMGETPKTALAPQRTGFSVPLWLDFPLFVRKFCMSFDVLLGFSHLSYPPGWDNKLLVGKMSKLFPSSKSLCTLVILRNSLWLPRRKKYNTLTSIYQVKTV